MTNHTPQAAIALVDELPHLVLAETVAGDLLEPVLMGAVLSPEAEALYRYMLWRIWSDSLPLLVVIMLNPSTADHESDDKTITGLITRARRWGYGGLLVVNLFALRSKEPDEMLAHAAPIGPENDRAIKLALTQNRHMVLCAWGTDGLHLNREVEVKCVISESGAKPYALKLCANGAPGHPLYIAQATKPFALSITIPPNVVEMTQDSLR